MSMEKNLALAAYAKAKKGSSGGEIFRVELFCGYPKDDEEGWIERTLAAIKAGKIIEVYDAGEGGYLKVSYGWWMEYEWDEETEEDIPVYHVGDWFFRELGASGGDEEGDEEYGDISDYEITIFEKDYHELDSGDGIMEDDPPRITISGISYRDLLHFYKKGVRSFTATWEEDTELGTPGEQTRCTFEFEEYDEDEWELTIVSTENQDYDWIVFS